MKQNLKFSILLFFLTFFINAQEVEFELLPYINAVTNIEDGQIEIGPKLSWTKVSKGETFELTPFIRLPLTDKSNNLIQIDRFSNTWKGILQFGYTKDNTKVDGPIKRNSFFGQLEIGAESYKYYPSGTKAENTEIDENQTSYGFEFKYIGYFTKGSEGARQYSPQFRLRYSNDWKNADKIGIVQDPDENGLVKTTDLIISGPNQNSLFSPALALQYYPGKYSYSYTPVVYYDFSNKQNNPFNGLQRLRIEQWIFFYPNISGNPNVKIGASPFFSIRTAGTDSFNKFEYGGMITIKYGSNFLNFF